VCSITLILCFLQFCSVFFEKDSFNFRLLDLQGEIETNNETKKDKPKILIYIATHMSTAHKAHFKHCWPLALKNSHLLNSSDVKLFITPGTKEVNESIALLNETFHDMVSNVSYHIDINHGYQEGARDAMVIGSKNGWFDSYDWIIRLNPDVIIQNDTWILDTITNDADASLLYIDCANSSGKLLIHTDFFAIKCKSIPSKHLETFVEPNFEFGFTKKMSRIIQQNQHRHVPDAYPKQHHFCRVNGNVNGPIFHYHTHNVSSPALENWTCPARFFN